MTEERGLVPHDTTLPSAAVQEELNRVNAICDTAIAVAQMMESQMMESFWKIRQELGGDRARFQMLVRAHTRIESERAWLMAETWVSARKNRHLRTLASQKPSEALQLVSQFVEGGIADELEMLSENDHETAQLLALPPRKRTAKVREMIAAAKAAEQGHNPADLERIRAAEAERDAAVEELDKERQLKLGAKTPEREALNALRDAEKRLAQAREALKPVLAGASHDVRDEVLRVGDLAMTTIERLHSEVYDAHDNATRIEPVK